MSNNSDLLSNGLNSTPAKTLWFEFLLHPKLLDSHLNNENSSPQPFELMTQLLTNALTTSTTTLSSLTTNNNNNNNHNNNGNEELNGLGLGQQQMNIKKEMDNKKSNAIRYLSFKIMAHLNWDLNLLETNLPPTQQDFLLSEFIRYCDNNKAPTSCKLFSCILYYRWILRYIMKSNYPLRIPKAPTIPLTLQQQIDPCFVSTEALDCLMKKLQEQYLIAVTDLEKVVFEKQKGSNVEISMPGIQCFTNSSNVQNNDFVCDWTKSVKMNICDVVDDILYDIGKWFFFQDDYYKANNYFELISMSKRESFNLLDGYLVSTRDLLSNKSNEVMDIELVDLDEHVKEKIEKIINGQTSDISSFENMIDLKEISNALHSAYKTYVDKKQRNIIKKLIKYLCSKVKGLNDLLNKSLFTKVDIEIVDINDSDVEMFEEGEIDAEEDSALKDPELLLLETTEPELIQSLVSKTQKHPMMINSKWSLPLSQSKLLHNLPQTQYEKCHIIFAKANQLRNAKLFIESRVLYLSLLEDIQASFPLLADAIKWELLRTDLEYHFDSTDVDERRITDLIGKCNRTLRTIDKKNVLEFQELTELCCVFLLESCPQSLKDFSNSSVGIIKFSSCISWLASDKNANSVNTKAKEFWELLVSVFVNPILVNKKSQSISLTFSNSFVSFMSKFKDLTIITLIISCISKVHNLVRDNPTQELTIAPQFASLWPSSLGSSLSATLDSNSISSALYLLLDEFLNQKPNEIVLLKCRAELSLVDGLYADALKHFTLILMINTKYFTSFSSEYTEEDAVIHRMIHCCVKLGCHTQAAVLHQLTREPNYALAFKALGERNCNDSCDDLYETIWDITLLEFLINLHSRRGETERKTKAIQLIGQLELNSNNSDIVLKEAADVRRGKLLRIFARTYL
jgi:integrator complex subunit 8